MPSNVSVRKREEWLGIGILGQDSPTVIFGQGRLVMDKKKIDTLQEPNRRSLLR